MLESGTIFKKNMSENSEVNSDCIDFFGEGEEVKTPTGRPLREKTLSSRVLKRMYNESGPMSDREAA